MKYESINLLEEPQTAVSEEKTAVIMTRNELIDNASKILKEAGIDTIQQLAKQLKSNQKIKNDAQREVFIEFLRKELALRAGERLKPSSYPEMGEYLAEKYVDLDTEEFHVISLNTAGQIIADECLAVGDRRSAVVDISKVMRSLILNKGVAAFFVMHNHPAGILEPSKADDRITKKLLRIAKPLGFTFYDHFIVSDGKYYSYRLNENIIK